MPEKKKGEFLDGGVARASPVREPQQGKRHSQRSTGLPRAAATPGVEGAEKTTVPLDLDHEVQADALLRLDEGVGGQWRIYRSERHHHLGDRSVTTRRLLYVEGAPELMVEMAASTASDDLHHKFRADGRHGVREVLVWVVLEAEFRWSVLDEGGRSAAGAGWGGLSEDSVLAGVGAGGEAALGGGDGAGVDEVTGGDGFARTSGVCGRVSSGSGETQLQSEQVRWSQGVN